MAKVLHTETAKYLGDAFWVADILLHIFCIIALAFLMLCHKRKRDSVNSTQAHEMEIDLYVAVNGWTMFTNDVYSESDDTRHEKGYQESGDDRDVDHC